MILINGSHNKQKWLNEQRNIQCILSLCASPFFLCFLLTISGGVCIFIPFIIRDERYFVFCFQSKQWIDNQHRLMQTLHISCFLVWFWMLIFLLNYNSDIACSLFLFRCVCLCFFFSVCWVLVLTRYRVWRINHLFLFRCQSCLITVIWIN